MGAVKNRRQQGGTFNAPKASGGDRPQLTCPKRSGFLTRRVVVRLRPGSGANFSRPRGPWCAWLGPARRGFDFPQTLTGEALATLSQDWREGGRAFLLCFFPCPLWSILEEVTF